MSTSGGWYPGNLSGATSSTPTTTTTPVATTTTTTPPVQLGSNLNTQYYGNYASQLPADMPGGGGGVISNYGAAPWVTNWNTGSTTLNGAQPGGTNAWNQGGSGYYSPYGMISQPIGTGPFSYGQGSPYQQYVNPYAAANEGSGVDLNDAYNNARWEQYHNMTSAGYKPAPPTVDTSPNSPFANAVQIQGQNTADWQRSDVDAASITPATPFQVAPGASVTGTAPPVPQGRGRWGRGGMHHRGHQPGQGWPSRYSPEIQAFLARDHGPDSAQSQLGWDQHNLRSAMDPNSAWNMSPEAAGRMRRNIMLRNGLMTAPQFAPTNIWGH